MLFRSHAHAPTAMCKLCDAESCTYGANRQGQRTESCCLCAEQHQGWAAFESRACANCRERRCCRPASPGPVAQARAQAPAEPYRAFGDAVRELRQQRLKRAAAGPEYVSSIEAVACAKQRRLAAAQARHDPSEGSAPALACDAAPSIRLLVRDQDTCAMPSPALLFISKVVAA